MGGGGGGGGGGASGGSAVEMGNTPMELSDDEETKKPQEETEEEVSEQPPDWLPDGWIMEVRRGDNGSIYKYYTSPVSGYTFCTKLEVLHYLVSEMDERVVESQASSEANTLQSVYGWLPAGWVIEIRAGGKKMDKMYKFYAHLPTGVRFFYKEDVLCYVNEGKLSSCDTKGRCDTSSEDNILAQVEFNPDGLPDGWVKEVTFRKCKDGIRKDPYFTDPVSHHVFRTLRDVMRYLESGEISKHAYIPRKSVNDMYSFDVSRDLPQSLLKRLKPGKARRKSREAPVIENVSLKDRTPSRSEEGGPSTSSDPKPEPKEQKFKTMKSTSKAAMTSENIKRPRGRPRKILKQSNKITSEHAKTSHHGSQTERHIVVKQEVESGDEKAPECLPIAEKKNSEGTAMEEDVMVIQEVENKTQKVGANLSVLEKDKLDLVIGPDLHEQENEKSAQDGERLIESQTCSQVHKVYMRRSCHQVLALKKDKTHQDHPKCHSNAHEADNRMQNC